MFLARFIERSMINML